MAAIKSAKINLTTAIALVIANMVGTGVFTSLGFQVMGIRSIFPLLMLWAVGGLIALAGALCYGELSSAMPRSGGEYHYLSKLYHPAIGFLSGWVSVTVGFAAPTALAAMALGSYANSVFPALNANLLALGTVAGLTAVHSLNLKAGTALQVVFTALKVLLLLVFIGAAFFLTPAGSVSVMPKAGDLDLLTSPAFAVSLIYVSYAYSGWNAAVYVSGEIKDPKKNLPRALVVGTVTVALLYIGLNYVFLRSTPLALLEGQVEVGFIAAEQIFGPALGNAMGLVISLLLVSTVSAMIFAGPRVAKTMGEDMKPLRFLARNSTKGIPVVAMLLQSLITMCMILSATFESVLSYSGFTLSLFTFLAVAGLFILRRRGNTEGTYRTWGYPVTPLVFLLLTLWTMVYLLYYKTAESVAGLGTLLLGLVLYYLNYKFNSKNKAAEKQLVSSGK